MSAPFDFFFSLTVLIQEALLDREEAVRQSVIDSIKVAGLADADLLTPDIIDKVGARCLDKKVTRHETRRAKPHRPHRCWFRQWGGAPSQFVVLAFRFFLFFLCYHADEREPFCSSLPCGAVRRALRSILARRPGSAGNHVSRHPQETHRCSKTRHAHGVSGQTQRRSHSLGCDFGCWLYMHVAHLFVCLFVCLLCATDSA